jgi:FdhD protein
MKTMENNAVYPVLLKRFSGEQWEPVEDRLAVEEPLAIQLSYVKDGEAIEKTIAITMRTPGQDAELALGFLFTESIIGDYNQVVAIEPGPQTVLVTLHQKEEPRLQHSERNFYTSSSCGVCGKTSIGAIRTILPSFSDNADQVPIRTELFFYLEEELKKQQALFAKTGGLHASALFDLQGKLLMFREDVGRHNALDKLIGASLVEGNLPLSSAILLLSGRASFELLQKAAMAGIRIVAAVGAPSSLAVQVAKEAGITLVGFLKNKRFNVYSGEERLVVNCEL